MKDDHTGMDSYSEDLQQSSQDYDMPLQSDCCYIKIGSDMSEYSEQSSQDYEILQSDDSDYSELSL